MAGEVTIRASLQITVSPPSGNISYQSPVTGYQADLAAFKGPCGGVVTVGVAGKDIDLAEVNNPGWAFFQNQDPTNFVQIGIREPATSRFFPLLILYPGQGFPVQLTPYLGQQYDGVGTGTSAEINKLHIKADRSPCNVLVQIFEA